MIKLAEVFPVDALGPIAGGAIIWFAANYGFLAPEVIAPRLAEKYYVPACLSAVQDRRQAHATERKTLVEKGRERVDRLTEEFRQRALQQGGNFWGMLLGNDREGQAVMRRHGNTFNQWTANAMGPALQQFRQQQFAILGTELNKYDQDARAGIVHAQPDAFCRCVVSVGFKDRFDLAVFTSSLRIYTPETIGRLKDGTMLHEAPACGKPPVV